jgi:hypothetical protein
MTLAQKRHAVRVDVDVKLLGEPVAHVHRTSDWPGAIAIANTVDFDPRACNADTVVQLVPERLIGQSGRHYHDSRAIDLSIFAV